MAHSGLSHTPAVRRNQSHVIIQIREIRHSILIKTRPSCDNNTQSLSFDGNTTNILDHFYYSEVARQLLFLQINVVYNFDN